MKILGNRSERKTKRSVQQLAQQLPELIRNEMQTHAIGLGLSSDATSEQIKEAYRKIILNAREEILSFYKEIDSIVGTNSEQSWKYIYQQSDRLFENLPYGKPSTEITTVLFNVMNEMKNHFHEVEKRFPQVKNQTVVRFMQFVEKSVSIHLNILRAYIMQHNSYNKEKLPLTIGDFKNWRT